MSEERRHYSRVPFDAEISIYTQERSCPAHLLDISLKGALVEFHTGSPFSKGTTCHLKINLNGAELVLDIASKLVFCKEEQAGLEFQEIDLDCLTHLRRLLELNTGDSEKVKDELFFLATHGPG